MAIEFDYRAVAQRRQVYIGNLENGFNRACELIVAAEAERDELLRVLAQIERIAEVHDGNGKLVDIARRAHAALTKG
mgnify:CR=1 FL=1